MNEESPSIDEIAHTLTFSQLTPEQWKVWKAQMRRCPQWFVLGKPGWNADRWRALAGPFNNPQEAQRVADTYADDGMRGDHQDLRLVYCTQVKSLTETVRMYRNNLLQVAEDLEDAGLSGSPPLMPIADEDTTAPRLPS
ncbi:hypothetical protein [Aggregatilinea lenta]|uniref:hypothetical protein n=1 Tax=Aggregatilinea lenta TaxID=913108 RepID=UPI000E5AF22C|nr:hypothetical protein [Aggregatilinea lenta]